MTPKQHALAKQIFLAACEQPVGQRGEFLDEACAGDRKLHRHISDLLRYHSEVELTVRTAESATSAGEPPCEAVGRDRSRRLESGVIVADRYRIVALLGQGGMGNVYRADDLVLTRPVALKFLTARFSGDAAWLARLVCEVRVAREITHPNVCRVHDIHVDSAAGSFISMEYIDGEDLRSLLRRVGRLAPDKALAVACEVCIGLAAAHAKGILHRDLKPANIMLDSAGRVRITDFGLAAPRESIAALEICSGTPGYMAPELFAGTDVSVCSDIYALGLVLYELFTARPAFTAESFTGFARLHQRAPAPLPSELVPDLPPVIDDVIQQCLRKDPSDRPASALAVAAALPGSDPLALALAAGVTPSPAFVASSGAGTGLRSGAATLLLVATFAFLLAIVLLAERAGLMPSFRYAKSASGLAERAELLASDLAPSTESHAQAFGFALRPAEEFFPSGLGTAHLAIAAQQQTAPQFWYRQSLAVLAPTQPLNLTFGSARPTLTDPPRTAPGMVTLVLDGQGVLLAFEAYPPHAIETGAAAPVNWASFFAAAGLDPQAFFDAPPQLEPWLPFDERWAWTARTTDNPPYTLRVEAAACRGKPVLFAILRAAPEPAAVPWYRDLGWRRTATFCARFGLLAIVLGGALPLARHNLRRGQGDRRGASRLAGLVLAGRFVIWALSAGHVPQLEVELRLLLFGLLSAFLEAGLVSLGYIALEPYVRRFWPKTIVTWSRLLTGQLRDPLVARDVLAGTLLGLGIVLLFVLDRPVLDWVGWGTREPFHVFYALEPLLGARYGSAACVSAFLSALYAALVLVITLVLARVALRRTWLASFATVAATMPMYLPAMAHPAWSWLPLAVVLTVLVWGAARYGLVMIVVAIFVIRLLLQLPLSFVPDTPGWDPALLVFLIIVGLAVYGFMHSRRRSACNSIGLSDRTAGTTSKGAP